MNNYTVGVELDFLLVVPETRRPPPGSDDPGHHRIECSRRLSADHPTVEVRVADIPATGNGSRGPRRTVRRPRRDGTLRRTGGRSRAAGGIFDRALSLVEHVEVALRDRGTLSTVEQHLDWLRHN